MKKTLKQNNELIIKYLVPKTIYELRKNEKLFQEFLRINKGFVDEVVLATIGRNKQHQDYEDLFQAACIGLFKALQKWRRGKSTFSTFSYKVMQNDVRQEIKRLNKQKHVIRKNNGTYFHAEIPMEYLLKNVDRNSESGNSANYDEMKFKETRRISQLRNFDKEILDKITLEDRIQKLNDLEKRIYELHYIEGLSIKKVAEKLGKSYGTVKLMFYERMKPKFDKMHKELGEI